MFSWRPDTTKQAVVLACDANFLPYASVLAWQVAVYSGARDFDIVIASHEPLDLPPILTELGVKSRQVPRSDALNVMSIHRLPIAAYLRMQLGEVLAEDYDRILYLDSDIHFAGGDLSRLLALDLKGAVLGAVRDVNVFYEPNYHAAEFKLLGLPPTPYINTGVLLIDTAAFVAQDIVGQAVATAKQRPDLFVYHDQSIINCVLKGNIAELHPGWNWMPNVRLPAVAQHQPIMFRHFITDQKPFRAQGFSHDHRFRAAYVNFFRTYAPQWVDLVPATPGAAPGYDAAIGFKRFWDQYRNRKAINAYLARFADEWSVIRWRPVDEK